MAEKHEMEFTIRCKRYRAVPVPDDSFLDAPGWWLLEKLRRVAGVWETSWVVYEETPGGSRISCVLHLLPDDYSVGSAVYLELCRRGRISRDGC